MRNIRAWKLGLEAWPSDVLSLHLDAYRFDLDWVENARYNFLQVPIRTGDPTGQASRYLGWEIDLHVRWTYEKRLRIWAGWSYFKPGEFPKDVAGLDKSMSWFFLQTTLPFY